ncbi:hypothetical protein VMCG_01986 [Cytospora schulzeri]|uniref:HAD-superfamily subfamily IIA hydrolase n=1 Tax=Cytospora schulzeri TaxID=448051 RepID=A0A423X3F0_9PEZI|nr:hypothetical protein VMCG_01986 [Valsa malicola]
MSVSSRAATKALPLLRSGLSRTGAGEAVRRCCGTSAPLSTRALGTTTTTTTCQRYASRGLAARRGLGAGGLRWYRSTSSSDSGKSVASSATSVGGGAPEFAFAFDIDGVLLHSSKPIPGATETLKYLQEHHIPFILLTNGGGKDEFERVADLSEKLGVELDVSNFVQSHSPYKRLLDPDLDMGFPDLERYFQSSIGSPRLSSGNTVLVLGSDASKARHIAHGYGFKSVVTPADILKEHPEIFPFDPLKEFYAKQETFPLPRPVYSPGGGNKLEDCLKVDAILVFNDPRDWAVDVQLVTDLLLSHRGYLGTYSAMNGDQALPRSRQWQSDGQPALIFSNADLLWSTGYHLSRLGQGAFRAALMRVWTGLVANSGAKTSMLEKFTFGKPELPTYWHAWDVLQRYYRKQQVEMPGEGTGVLRRVYMVGDNPESDIRGVWAWNDHLQRRRVAEKRERPIPPWRSYLVRTGVWAEDRAPLENLEEAARPHNVTDDVKAAVNSALEKEGWSGRVE